MTYAAYWANPDKIGVIIRGEGTERFIDAGEEYEAAIAAGPLDYPGPSEAIDPDAPDPLAEERRGMVVSRLQARAALLGAGLLDQVERAVNGGLLSGGSADPLTRMAWNEATEFRRNSPTIAALAKLMGLSEEALDDLFRTAKRIEF